MSRFLADSFSATPPTGIAAIFARWQAAQQEVDRRRKLSFDADDAMIATPKTAPLAERVRLEEARRQSEANLQDAEQARNGIEEEIFAAPATDGPSIAMQLQIVRAVLIQEVEWTDDHFEVIALDRAVAFLSAQKGA